MKKSILVFDISDRERLKCMVKVFADIETADVYFFKKGKFRLYGFEGKIKKLPFFDLVIQHRSDPLADAIQFSHRLWYGGGEQTKKLEQGEETIKRKITNAAKCLSLDEALQTINFFFNQGPKPPFFSQYQPSLLDHVYDFIRTCVCYNEGEKKDGHLEIDLKHSIAQIKNILHLNTQSIQDDFLIAGLDKLITTPKGASFKKQLQIVRDLLLQQIQSN